MTYIFFADEADQDKSHDGGYFIYGGAAIEVGNLKNLTQKIDDLRQKFGFSSSDSLKFSPHDKPKGMTTDDFISCKSEIFDIAKKCQVHFIGYACNNNCIAKQNSYKTKFTYGANQLLAKFNRFLIDRDDYGIVSFDKMPLKNHRDYLKSKFSDRLQSEKFDSVDRILAYTTCYDNTSHLASVADILVGSFRMIVNEPQKDKAGRTLAKQLKNLFAKDPNVTGRLKITDYGLIVRPRVENIVHHKYRQQNLDLTNRILNWANE